MKIALINGSPKPKRSGSAVLLAGLRACFPPAAECSELALRSGALPPEAPAALEGAAALVLACPLYVDGLPGHLLSALLQLEAVWPKGQPVPLYGLVNCGFYEGVQAEPALLLLENFCARAGLSWGGGLGVGGGGSLCSLAKSGRSGGPMAPVEAALARLAARILRQEAGENSFVSVGMPRFVYKLSGEQGWRRAIRARGGRVRDLGRRPD